MKAILNAGVIRRRAENKVQNFARRDPKSTMLSIAFDAMTGINIALER
jgi:hypothetical protein